MFWEHMEFSGLPLMAMVRRAASVLLLSLICTGCGDIFRPVANPIPGPAPDPQNFHFAIVASQNAPGNPGSGMQIDVSGDTNIGTVPAGSLGVAAVGQGPQGPVHAAILSPGGNRVYLANGTDDTVATFSPASTFGAIGKATTIILPTDANPVFVPSTDSKTQSVVNYTM